MKREPLSFVVAESQAGQRLDKLVAARLGGLGRRATRDLFARGAVRVGRRAASKGELAQTGAEIVVDPGEERRAAPEPELDLDVRLEAPEIVVVSKPAGRPTAPLHGGERGTLCGALVGRYP